MKDLTSFIKGGLLYTVTDLTRKLSPLLLLPLYISYLSVEEFGKLEYITILTTLFGFIVGWGSTQGLLRLYITQEYKYISCSVLLIFVVAIVLLFLLYCIDNSIAIAYYIGVSDIFILYLCIGYALLLSVNNLAYTILRVEDRLVEYSLFNLLATLLQVICIYFLLAYAKEGYLSKIYGLFISNAILVIVLFERVMKGKLPLSFGFKDLKELLFFYTPISMTNILGWGRSSLDKVAVKVILGDEMLGLYSFMIQISQIFKMGMESFLKSLNVIVYKSTSTLNLLKEKKYLYIAILQLFSIGYYFLALAVDSLGYFGEYTVVGGMFLIIMLSRTILLSTYIESLIFYERKSSLYVMKSNLYSVMVLVSTMLPLIYMLQLYGAVISVLIAALLNFSLLYSKNSLDLENKSTVVKTLTYILFPWFLIGVIQYA